MKTIIGPYGDLYGKDKIYQIKPYPDLPAYFIVEFGKDVNVISTAEVVSYWHEGCWGKQMEGIAPEIGVWHSKKMFGKPIRIYPWD